MNVLPVENNIISDVMAHQRKPFIQKLFPKLSELQGFLLSLLLQEHCMSSQS